MNKLLVICGPTATGKTDLGIYLAKKFEGEIASADSRQVYKGMDIGTGKDLPVDSKYQVSRLPSPGGEAAGGQASIKYQKINLGYYLFNGVRAWLLDVVEPNQEFSVAHYVELAQKVMEDIWRRGKLPIVVGGTGFYIKGLIDGIETLGAEPDWELRIRLKDLPAQKLFDFLARLDATKAASMNVSDRQNPRRLIRAIEIASKNQKPKTKNLKPCLAGRRAKTSANALFIGFKAPFKKLYQRIDKRVEERVRKGAEKEVKVLIKKGYSWDLPAMSAMGYREWQPYFEGKATKEEIIQKWKFAEHAYARRQLTWFRRDPRIRWFDISERSWKKGVEGLVKSWYNEKIKVQKSK
jgi:tRNA dimethylallyltransferase